MNFILYNGKIIPVSDYNPGESWWRSDFSLSQDMWFAQGDISHFSEHLRNLVSLLDYVGRPIPEFVSPPGELLRLSRRLINKNKAFMGGWLTLRLIFNGLNTEYVASVRHCPERLFPLDLTGKMGTISPWFKCSGNSLSRFSFFPDMLWKCEQFRRGDTQNEESLFLNEKGIVTEGHGANLFCIRKNLFLTPAEETGCIIDPMRKEVIRSAQAVGFQVIQSVSISAADLNDMEELFLVSEGTGFRWLMGIGAKRFLKNGVELIWRQVNKSCFPGVS